MRPLAIAALVVGAAGAGVAAYLVQQHRAAARAPPPPATTESRPPCWPSGFRSSSWPTANGDVRSLADWQGKSLIVNFWATWCAPCRREIPLLRTLQDQYGPQGFQVIGIAVDYRDKVLAYADDAKFDYPILIGEQDALDAAAAFGVEIVGFPFTVFSDNSGRIITCHVGELTGPVAQAILGAVERVNQGRATPAEARLEIEAAMARLKGEKDSHG